MTRLELEFKRAAFAWGSFLASAPLVSYVYAHHVDHFSMAGSAYITLSALSDIFICSGIGALMSAGIGWVVVWTGNAFSGRPESTIDKLYRVGFSIAIACGIAVGIVGGITNYKLAAARYTQHAIVKKTSRADQPSLPLDVRQSGNRVVAFKID
jgi:hypothetical protein